MSAQPLHFTALRQVTDLPLKYIWQAEIRGRMIEWQEFDQSPHTQTHAHTQEILMFPLSTWRYFVAAPSDKRPPQKQLHRCLLASSASSALGVVVSGCRERCKLQRKKVPFLFNISFSSLGGLICPIAQHASSSHGEGALFVFLGGLPYWGHRVEQMGGRASVQTDD